uniref:Cation diffusion facilitator family transporter n=1 Tax=Cyanothece sp. (strain PCC 7425 / ATCC 29141) TaxID=395961 RepID=B8HUU0_CYAP4
MRNPPARRYIILSIGVAILNLLLKFAAYGLTGSVGLLSDALESGVNLVAALVGFWALTYAAKPADASYAFGYSKAEYFSSGVEGALILVAALSIAIAAWDRLLQPQPLEQIGWGLGLTLLASILNGVLAWKMLQAGRRLRSITLRADAHHLLTDVWTSGGVVLGLLLIHWTGWLILDPLIALIVAVNIIWAGVRLLRETGSGLLDASLPADEQALITTLLQPYQEKGIQFHALRTRIAASRRFVAFHVLVPGDWTVKQGHQLCEEIELKMIQALPGASVFTHLEPLDDPISWADQDLDRPLV